MEAEMEAEMRDGDVGRRRETGDGGLTELS